MNYITKEHLPCARSPDCMNIVGVVPFRIFGRSEEYCSENCVKIAFEEGRKTQKKKRKEEDNVKISAEDFGDSGVVRHCCDTCGKPLGLHPDGTVTLAWKGRYGEYCSNNCLKSREQGEVEMTEETAAAPSAKPIVAGKPSEKKTSKTSKKTTTAAPKAAKTPTPKAPKSAGDAPKRARFADDAEIKVLKTGHECRGKRGDALNALKDGTVEKYKAALAKKDLASYVGWALTTALELKLISIK